MDMELHALQHAGFSGPEGELDANDAGLHGMHVEAHFRLAVGGDINWPILLRTGATQLASAQLAVETG